MTNLLLFSSTVLIWGTTWIAIALQIGPVPVLVSVFYRFALAALVLVGVLALTGRLKVPTLKQQPFILVQALSLFCCNFLCFYHAASYVPSGLISVVFSLATVYNAVNARIFFGDPIKPRTLSQRLGATGLALLFGPEIFIAVNPDSWKGIGLSALGTLFFSFGNMASRRNSAEGIAPVTANAWGMSYGSRASRPDRHHRHPHRAAAGPDLSRRPRLSLGHRLRGRLHHLSDAGLAHRLAEGRLCHGALPVVALTLSSLYEDYHFTPLAMVGLALTLAGNAVMFARLPRRQPVPPSSRRNSRPDRISGTCDGWRGRFPASATTFCAMRSVNLRSQR